jgi:hypothetical protein
MAPVENFMPMPVAAAPVPALLDLPVLLYSPVPFPCSLAILKSLHSYLTRHDQAICHFSIYTLPARAHVKKWQIAWSCLVSSAVFLPGFMVKCVFSTSCKKDFHRPGSRL